MARTPLQVTELDFDGIKNSLKAFLRSKDSPIKDYEYEGSTFNILLDVLAANTHYNSLYANFVSNEMFLDSALMRSSVVSIAKELGYVPRSCRASKTTLTVSIAPFIPGSTTIQVPAETKFSTNIDGSVFVYTSIADHFLSWDGEAYTGQVDVYCGDVFTQSIQFEANKRIYIESDSVDTTTLLVTVQNSINDVTTRTFSYFGKVIDLDENSLVYFLQETDLKRYTIKFGDGVLGKALETGNIVGLRYLSANLSVPAGATNFLQSADFFPGFSVTVTADFPASAAVDVESVEEIRRNVQRYNQAQERSVIAGDYIHHILQDNPDIKDVIVWGGEDNDPPQYGKVFVSTVMNNLSIMPVNRKIALASMIKTRSTMNIRPTIIDPEYMSVSCSGFVRYQAQTIGLSEPQLKTAITEALRQYSETSLERFNASLAFSNISKKILEIDPAITSVVFGFSVSHSVPITDKPAAIKRTFRTPIRERTFSTEKFFKNGDVNTSYSIEDVGNGILNEFKFVGNLEQNKTFVRQCGTVNYASGEVVIEGVSGAPVNGTLLLTMSFSADSTEISSDFNQILSIDHLTSGVRIEVRGS